jgi:F-type H+-transporting ATPase subunit gamma
MASLRELRSKIKSVKSTQQITKAMKMVAAARLRRAQTRILSARPFALKMEELMNDVMRRMGVDHPHPLTRIREGHQRVVLLVTSDKGLCGAFNTNLIRETVRYIQKYQAENVRLFVVGRKGRDYFKRIGIPITKDYTNIFNNLGFQHAEIITADLLQAFENSAAQAVDMIYAEFKSVVQQRVIIKPLLPLIAPSSEKGQTSSIDFIYEPAKEVLIEGLILRFLKAQVFRILLESAASELGARMSAMENATKNASELIESLTLTLNRNRQASITKEILEVVSGAEALK